MLLQNDPFFSSVLNRFVTDDSSGGYLYPPMDAYRRGADVWVHLDVPGVTSDSIDISVERNVLTVTAQRGWKREEGDQIYLADRRQGQFRRQVHLGDGLDAEGIEADYADGVLTLRIPVAERAKARKISVNTSAAIEAESVPVDG
jgi:HSP20 family protein